jgi:sortase (surface protein transpeptidase)
VPDVPIQGTQPAAIRVPVPPVRVAVPDASIDVSVEPVGVLPDGEMELPTNTAVAGWYRFGPDPASGAGATVLAAHVDSLVYGLGPFSRLKGLGVGSTVTVTTADGAAHAYTITSSTRVAKEEIDLDSVFTRDGPPVLVMMTCGGQFNHETGHYLDNILVTATPTGP